MKKHFLIIAAVVLVVVIIAMFLNRDEITPDAQTTEEDPMDVTLTFYGEWLEAITSTSTPEVTPVSILRSDRMASELSSVLIESWSNRQEDELDPVLCQTVIPGRVGGKILYQTDDAAQVIVLARGLEEKATQQAIVSLNVDRGAWQITDISCATGEIPPERDYPFEQEGYILKSVPPPLNSDYWHLVFEQAGVMGHTVPLFFDAESICVDMTGTESVCEPQDFNDATKVYVQADMTESGAEVKRLSFLP